MRYPAKRHYLIVYFLIIFIAIGVFNGQSIERYIQSKDHSAINQKYSAISGIYHVGKTGNITTKTNKQLHAKTVVIYKTDLDMGLLNNIFSSVWFKKNSSYSWLPLIILFLSFLIRISAFVIILTFYRISRNRPSWFLISGAFLILSLLSLDKLYQIPGNPFPQNYTPLELAMELGLSLLLLAGVIYFSKILPKAQLTENLKQAAEERFMTIFNNSTDMVIVIDKEGSIVEINRSVCEKLGFTKTELLARHFKSIRSASELSESISEMMERTGSKHHFSMETEFYDRQNRAIPVEINCREIVLGEKPYILCMGRDIAERKELEKKILRTIIHTEEKERSRFAKELHDGMGPLLSSIKLYINELESEDLNPDEKRRYTRYADELLNEAIRNTREISNNLTPKVITDYGLVKALSSFCHKINKTHQIDIRFDHELYTERLEEQVELNLYRIITELVNNTLKHAEAQNVEIILEHQSEKIRLQYSDDGRGFDFENVIFSENRGLGLRNILSRIRSLNGNYQVLPVEKGIRFMFVFSTGMPLKKV